MCICFIFDVDMASKRNLEANFLGPLEGTAVGVAAPTFSANTLIFFSQSPSTNSRYMGKMVGISFYVTFFFPGRMRY